MIVLDGSSATVKVRDEHIAVVDLLATLTGPERAQLAAIVVKLRAAAVAVVRADLNRRLVELDA